MLFKNKIKFIVIEVFCFPRLWKMKSLLVYNNSYSNSSFRDHHHWILYWAWNSLPQRLLLAGSVHFSGSVVSHSLRPHELQPARPPCPSPTARVHSNSCPSSWWCHPPISSSVVPFSSCPQSLPASGSFPMSQLFTWGAQIIGVSASAYQSFQWTPRTDLL